MTDLNPLTSMTLPGSYKLIPSAGLKQLTLLKANDGKTVTAVQRDKKGKELSRKELTASVATLAIDPKATEIELLGNAEIFEIIRK